MVRFVWFKVSGVRFIGLNVSESESKTREQKENKKKADIANIKQDGSARAQRAVKHSGPGRERDRERGGGSGPGGVLGTTLRATLRTRCTSLYEEVSAPTRSYSLFPEMGQPSPDPYEPVWRRAVVR